MTETFDSEKPRKTPEELEELVRNQAERIEVYERLVQGYRREIVLHEEFQDASNKAAAAREIQIQAQEALLEALRSNPEMRIQQADAFEQAALYSQALQESAEHYAIQAKAILIYTLERVPRGEDWPRLWEALPRKQKIEYLLDGAAWLRKQPIECDPELRKKLKEPPERPAPPTYA